MAKKFKISSLLINGMEADFPAIYFRTGGYPLNKNGQRCIDLEGNLAFPKVKDITYCRHSYGNGAFVDEPCYVIRFEESSEKIILPKDERAQITVISFEEEEGIPNLPE